MTWTRLEGGSVSADLTPGLSARIADPLWMLARQWQVGELAGEDAGSPMLTTAVVDHQPVGEFRVGKGVVQALEENSTLEAQIECEDVYAGPSRPRLAAVLGAHLLRLAAQGGADAGLTKRLRRTYRLAVVPPTGLPDDVRDPRGSLELELLARRAFDGLALAAHLRAVLDAAGAHGAPAPPKPVDPALGDVRVPDSLAARFLADAESLVQRPGGGAVWDVERLEYRFSVAAPAFAGGTVLTAQGYPGGHLDWSDVDVALAPDPPLGTGARSQRVRSVAVPVQYPGMPANRFWEIEDGAVSWADLDGGPTDLARYLVGSYAVLFGDDWSLLGVDLPRGSLTQVRSVTVLDSFGRTIDVPATAASDHVREGEARAWRFWELSGDPSPARGEAPLLLLPAALPPHELGRPVEEVSFLRDEVANLGWAMERVVEAPSGRRVVRSGGPRPDPGQAAPAGDAGGAWRYDLATPVPANAVPLVPVRLSETDPSIRFQRGRIATSADGSRGAVGLVLVPDRRLLLHEEEIPGGGIQVSRAWESCRAPDGGLLLWMSRRKRPGRGPRAPGLRHDVVTPTTGGAAETGVEPDGAPP